MRECKLCGGTGIEHIETNCGMQVRPCIVCGAVDELIRGREHEFRRDSSQSRKSGIHC